jgi:hypothetical protein
MPTPSARFTYDLIIGPDAIDANGHANNVEFVRWMQEAAIAHSDAVGCTAATLAAGGVWVVRSHRIEYLRPAFAGDRVAVVTWVADYRRAFSMRRYEFVLWITWCWRGGKPTGSTWTPAPAGRGRSPLPSAHCSKSPGQTGVPEGFRRKSPGFWA